MTISSRIGAFFHAYTLRLKDQDLGEVVDYMSKWYVILPEWRMLGKYAGASFRLHKFHQGDPETDVFHDHEYHFTTFPFVSYREGTIDEYTGQITEQTVPGRRWTPRAPLGYHVVYGRWYEGNHDTGVCNKYEAFWTFVVGLKPYRKFSLVKWRHPEGLTYDEVLDNPDEDVRRYWIRHQHDMSGEEEDAEGVRLFSDDFIETHPLRGPSILMPSERDDFYFMRPNTDDEA